MTELNVADLVLIAGQTLGISTETALGQLDIAAARAAVTEARRAAGPAGIPGAAPPGPLSDRAAAATAGAALMHALLRHRSFPGHGEQVAVAAGLQFLAHNGWRAGLDPPGEAASVIRGVASGQLAAAAAAAWLTPRLTPVSFVREATMPASRPGLWSRAREFLAPVTGLIPRHAPGVHTRATGFIPMTGQARASYGLAWRLAGHQLGTEHILLGLIGSDGTAARALERLGIGPEAVRQQVGRVQHRPRTEAAGAPEATLAARQVLAQWALGEALGRGHRSIDTEDLLLALYREADGAAAQALARLGAGESRVRGAVAALLAESGPAESGAG